jgi:outer membrane protein
MKKPIRTLCALLALGAGSLVAQAQPAFKLVVVDMGKLFDTHWESIQQGAKLQSDADRAKDDAAKMRTEGVAMVEEYKQLVEQANNPALTTDAKAKAQAEAQKKYQVIQQKENELQSFMQQTDNTLRTVAQNFRSVMLEKIGRVAADVGKRKGATMIVDKFGPTMLGISNVVYFDPAYDITDEVAAELAKNRPPGAPTAPPSAAAPAPAPNSGDAPKLNVPTLKKN